MSDVSAGWYADPAAPASGQLRYWDGAGWTAQVAAAAPAAPPPGLTPPSPTPPPVPTPWAPSAPSTYQPGYAYQAPPASAPAPGYAGSSGLGGHPPAPLANVGVPVRGRRDKTSGKQLLAASWSALKADRELLVLPVMSFVASLLAVVLIVAVGLVAGLASSLVTHSTSAVGTTSTTPSPLGVLVAVLLAYVTTAIAVYFQVALAAGAMDRMDGRTPTLGSCLAAANRRLPQILLWAAIAATVGLVLRAISERTGLIGRLVIALVGVAWAVLTFFVVPVILVEGTGSFSALGRSKELLAARWGKVGRSGVRFGLMFGLAMLAAVALAAVGLGVTVTGLPLVGIPMMIAGVVGVLAVSLLSSAVATYLRTALYRYAVGLPVPGIPPQVLAGAIRAS